MDPLQVRQTLWNDLSTKIFDLLIIGGGITGAGIARDAALRGLKVALIEKGDFASGTSSKSSKLIHGGLRYLEQFELGLVFEALQERKLLLKRAPHLVHPLLFLFPLYQGQSPSKFVLNSGLWLYDILSGFSAPKHHQMYNAKQLAQLEPALHVNQLQGGALYFDHQTNDARLTLENILDASSLDATVLSYACAKQIHQTSSVGDTKGENISFVDIEDTLSSQRSLRAKARLVINATGPWTDQKLSFDSWPPSQGPVLRPTKGVHAVVDAVRLPVRHAMVMKAPQDGRIVFALPWSEPTNSSGNRTILGTTDTDFSGNPDQVVADQADIQYLLECANTYFPQVSLTEADILATWAGLRPLIASQREKLGASKVSREHEIFEQPGFIAIAGGKLTTYRRMASEVVDRAVLQLGKSLQKYPCKTQERFFPGACPDVSEQPAVVIEKVRLHAAEHGISPAMISHWYSFYGSRADELISILATLPRGWEKPLDEELPYCMAQVDFAVLKEQACRLADVLGRRCSVLLRARDQGLACAEQVARRMAIHWGWDEGRIQEEMDRYRNEVQKSRAYKKP